MRDPFVLPCEEDDLYYLFGTTDEDPWHGAGVGFDAYCSRDLVHWTGPFPAFRPPSDFWADRNFWAPEVHRVGDGYVLFATFKSSTGPRAVQALVSDRPLGPYGPHGDPLTPADWECLDGTLFFEEGEPWLVFCHEWLQVLDGEICRVKLSRDLSRAVSSPELLFRASEAPWVRPVQEKFHFVTDGPFLHRCSSGVLCLVWSSFSRKGYSVGLATSSSGKLAGPWRHRRRPLVHGLGGHAMVFRELAGGLRLALHGPNRTPEERPMFLPLEEAPSGLRVRKGRFGRRAG